MKEYKISQYADDTQLFLHGGENSIRETLDILQFFLYNVVAKNKCCKTTHKQTKQYG